MKNNPWQAIVFDLDGTLVDSLRDLAEAMNASLTKNGFQTYSLEEYRYLVGSGMHVLIDRAAGKDISASVHQTILDDFLSIYDKDCLHYTKPYAGIVETLMQLKIDGIKILAVTNKPDAQAHKIIHALFGDKIFDGIFGIKEGRKIKPDPSLTLQALKTVQAQPEKSLFIGDSDVDIYTAAHAGMKSAGVLWGFRNKEELQRAGALFILHKPSEILNSY